MLIFSTTVTLALEVQGSADPDPQFIQAVRESKDLLKRVQSQNKLASEALLMLDELNSIESL